MMADPSAYPAISQALVAAREAVDAMTEELALQDHDAPEEVLTIELCRTAYPHVEYALFNRHQEHTVGGDWVWWFVDSSGECFGILIQAKRMKRTASDGWSVDLDYPASDPGRQRRRLLSAADRLELCPAYVVYTEPARIGSNLECKDHHGDGCGTCKRLGVGVVPGLIADRLVLWNAEHGPASLALDTYRYCIPLEDAVDPARGRDPVIDLNLRSIPSGHPLKDFLLNPQVGARAVAREVFRILSVERGGQFAAAAPTMEPAADERLFSSLPGDAGHFGVPYFDHVLRGLRARSPDYVGQVLTGEIPTPPVITGLAGVVVVHL